MAMISINAIYNYDPRIFDKIVLPDGIKKADAVDNICFECAELSLIYTDPGFLKNAIGQWSRKELKVWTKLLATENFDYNPIWNVDGTVVEREVSDRNKNGSITRNTRDQETTTGNETETVETNEVGSGTSSTTDIKGVTGYNSTNWQDHERDTASGSTGDRRDIDSQRRLNKSGTTSANGTEDVSDSAVENGERNLETRRTGNIGVTTTQQMIREEREVDQFNTIDYITQSFKKRFCVMVY